MAEEKLSENIQKLKQEISQLGHNYALSYVNTAFVEKMELEHESNNLIYSDYLKQLNTITNKCLHNYEDYASFISLKNIYSEALIFSILNSILKVEKIPETSVKSPDFKISYKNKTSYIEVKSINMADGSLKHRDIMENALESKNRLENKLYEKKQTKNTGKNIVVSDITIDKPYLKGSKSYNESSPKLVVETLIDKINQNLKSDQFDYGDTLLLVDFSGQLPMLDTPRNSLQENYIAEFVDNSELFSYLIDANLSMKQQQEYLGSLESISKQQTYYYKHRFSFR
jgi:hypothetical protein